MKRFIALLALVTASAFGQPIAMRSVLTSYHDLTNHVAGNAEIVTILAAYDTNNMFGIPSQYVLRTDLSTSLHNPPLYFREKNGRGVWRATFLDSTVLDVRYFGVNPHDADDDTAAFQAALNYAVSNNITMLMVPPGTNYITALSVTGTDAYKGFSIVGPDGNTAKIRGTSAGTMISIANIRRASIRNLLVDGQGIATNILNIDACTELDIRGNIFINSAGSGIRFGGAQNYGHVIAQNQILQNVNYGVVFDATSAAANTIRDNVIQAPGYTNTSVAVALRRGAANNRIENNTIQSVAIGIDNRGDGGGANLANVIVGNYFEDCITVPIRLGAAGQVTGVTIENNYFNTEDTVNGWAMIDGGPSANIFGLAWRNNMLYPDASKALNLTNAAGLSWSIETSGADLAEDYQLGTNVPVKLTWGNLKTIPFLVTNYATASSTNLVISMYRAPNKLWVNADSNAAVTLSGTPPNGAQLVIRNISTNHLYFQSQYLRQGIDEEFVYIGGNWQRSRGPYLRDTGGTIYGSVTVTNALTVGGIATVTGRLNLSDIIDMVNGTFTYGTLGGSNIHVWRLDTGSMGVIQIGTDNYMIFGTNSTIRAEKLIDANVGITLGGVTRNSWPTSTTYTEGNGIVISGIVISGDYIPGAGIGFSTNGSGQITISNTGTNSGAGSTNGSALYIDSAYAQTGNFIDSPEIDPSISGTNVTLSIVANSIATNKIDSTFRDFFKDRSTDTGTQTASTISDFADTQWANFTNSMIASNNVSIAYDASNKKLMISSTATGGGGTATNAPTIAVDGVGTTNINLADSAELLVTQTGTNVTYLLAASGATAGSYTNPTLYVDSKGRITNIVSGTGSTSSVGTVDRMWRTIAGVSFVSTNDGGGTYTELDGSSIVYSGVGSNLTISGSTDVEQAVYFNLEFSTPVSHTNYVVLADIESDRAINSGGIFVSAGVDTATGRTTNGVTFAIVSTAGSVNFSLGDRRIRVWVIDPNSLISGEELTSIDASLLTGTIDILRLPSEVATDSEVAASMGAFTNGTGSLTLSNLTITGTLSAGSLTVPTNAYSVTWATNLTVPTKKDLYDKIETLATSDPWGNGSFDIVDELLGPTSSYGANNGVSTVNNASAFSSTTEAGHPGIMFARIDAQGDAPSIGFHRVANIYNYPSYGSDELYAAGVVFKTPTQTSGGTAGDWIFTFGHQAYASVTNYPPQEFIGFVHCTNLLGTMNWGFDVSSNWISSGIIDTGVPVSASTWYTLLVEYSATNVVGYINGTAVVTNSTGLLYGRPGCVLARAIRTSTSTITTDFLYDRFRFKYYKP